VICSVSTTAARPDVPLPPHASHRDPRAKLVGLVERFPARSAIPGARVGGYVGRAAVVETLQITDAVRDAIAAGRSLAEVQQIARDGRALMPFVDYARHLLHKQIISATEVLLSLAD